MKKRILLIGYNFYPEPTGIGKYSGEMINWLASDGYDCTVITAYPYYPYWQIQEPYIKNRFWYKTEVKQFKSGGKIMICRCPMYVPSKPSGLRRIFLDFSFLISAVFKLSSLLSRPKFDFVFVVAPSFQFGLLGVLYKKLYKAKFLYHIQDMQIEAARDLNIIKHNKVIDYLFKIERYIFDNADIVSSISSSMVHKIQNKANKEVIFFPNWADIKSFHPIEDKLKLKSEFGFSKADIIILYSGAIGEKQGLESIVYLAKEFILQSQLKFIICGSGPYKQQLLDLAASMNIHNIRFFPIQPIEKFNRFLNMADVHLVIQKSHAGDLVMPSKLVTILAIGGLALITADEASGLYSLIKEHNMGLLVKADNQQALFSGIQKAISEDNCVITKNARTYAENHLSIDSVMETFINDVSL